MGRARAGVGAPASRAELRKEDLIRHAEALFAKRGYAETRMTDISEAAGVTKGLLYWYFASKEALIGEILRDIREQLRTLQRDVTRPLDEPLEKIYVGTVASVRFVLEHYRLFEVNVPFTEELRDVWGESAVVHASDTAEMLREGQRLGTIRDDDPAEVLALGNAGIVNEFCAGHHRRRIRASVDETAHMAARFIVRGLAVEPAAADRIAQQHLAV